MKFRAGVLLAFLAGCANTGVVELSPGTFLLSKQDNSGIFGNFERFKTNVIREANGYAAAKGKVAVPVTMRETPAAPGRFATFQYQFRLVDPNDPAAQGVVVTRQPDVLVESRSRNNTEVTVRDAPPNESGVYDQLLKLDELRKKGILTQSEFDAQKARLLEGLEK
jgi:Short C-terminal domain